MTTQPLGPTSQSAVSWIPRWRGSCSLWRCTVDRDVLRERNKLVVNIFVYFHGPRYWVLQDFCLTRTKRPEIFTHSISNSALILLFCFFERVNLPFYGVDLNLAVTLSINCKVPPFIKLWISSLPKRTEKLTFTFCCSYSVKEERSLWDMVQHWDTKDKRVWGMLPRRFLKSCISSNPKKGFLSSTMICLWL